MTPKNHDKPPRKQDTLIIAYICYNYKRINSQEGGSGKIKRRRI
jgi:hypothetical protein